MVWLWLRESKPLWFGIAGSIILILYGIIPTLQSFPSFGRVHLFGITLPTILHSLIQKPAIIHQFIEVYVILRKSLQIYIFCVCSLTCANRIRKKTAFLQELTLIMQIS